MANEPQLIRAPLEFKSLVLEKISQARYSIDLSFYIFGNDNFGNQVIDALAAKVSQGVVVRLLVDGYGSLGFVNNMTTKLHALGIQVRVFHPLPWPFSGDFFSALNPRSRSFYLLWNVNIRNHHKMMIVDGETGIIGSRNIHDDTLDWNELSLVVSNSDDLNDLLNIFEVIWDRSHEKFLEKIKSRLKRKKTFKFERVISNHTRALKRKKEKLFLSLIASANQQISIVTPYFLPTKKYLAILKGAVDRGVRVEIILPALSDVPFSQKIARFYYSKLMTNKIKIFEYHKQILHSKYMLLDGIVIVGSSNFNCRSRIRDLEIDYMSDEPSLVEKFKEILVSDLQHSNKVSDRPHLDFYDRLKVSLSLIFFRSWF